jgi:hypothetical protein
MSLELGRSGKDDQAASADGPEEGSQSATRSAPGAAEPTASDAPAAYADSGVSPAPAVATPAFSAVWGAPETSSPEDVHDAHDSDEADTRDTPETPAASEDSSVLGSSDAPETSDATEATSAPDALDALDADEASGAADEPGVAETPAEPDAFDASDAAEPSADDGRLSVAARLEEAAGDLDGPLLGDVAGLRASWQRIQFGFVDDPREAVEHAADLVEHTAQALASALQQRHRLLRSLWDRDRPLDDPGSLPASVSAQAQPADRSRPTDNIPGTEDLRLLMQRYRTMFNEICRP